MNVKVVMEKRGRFYNLKELLDKPYELVEYDSNNHDHNMFIYTIQSDSEISKWIGDSIFYDYVWKLPGVFFVSFNNVLIGRMSFYYLHPYSYTDYIPHELEKEPTLDELHLHFNYAIIEKYRGQGHLTNIMNNILHNLHKIGEKEIYVEVAKNKIDLNGNLIDGNIPSLKIINNFGFEQVIEEKGNYNVKGIYVKKIK